MSLSQRPRLADGLIATPRRCGPLNISTDRQGGALIAMAEGRVDGANALEFHEALEAAISPDDTGMVLDFEGISYISSAGLRVVLLVAKTLQKQNAKMAVCSLSDSIREIFEISGFDKIIPVHGSRADALAGVGG
ncbi:MAG: STAS domain-containing protein [Acidimicrobiaceae bacterium]|nr:STAS domain-containing protein [Acidimicrobiaceae bacterium]